MFERYTEKARAVIFFARYEASEFGSPVIDTEHLLLGLIRKEKFGLFSLGATSAAGGDSGRGRELDTTSKVKRR
jgi:hypothetical protein